jgi:hypothetical protein
MKLNMRAILTAKYGGPDVLEIAIAVRPGNRLGANK